MNSVKVIDIRDTAVESWRPGVETRMVVSRVNGAAQLCIFEQWVAPGHGAPTHSHPVEEVLTVRDGEAEMGLAQLLHELGPHLWAALAQQFRANAELLADRQMFVPPCRHLREDRQQFDALRGQ